MSYIAKPAHGFLLGNFMPPHQGHIFLCDFARAYADHLTILVCSEPDDPIPGYLRHRWMKELYPDCTVAWSDDVLPLEPANDTNSWSVWRDVVARHAPAKPDVLFASEGYGMRLAAEIDARFVPVDIARNARSISATDIRRNPMRHWDELPPVVRPYYAKRVTLFGAESTGKSTLAKALAAHYRTIIVPEYGRTHTETFGDCGAEGLREIVQGHLASVEAAKRQANRVIIEDTDPVLTAIWSDMLLGTRDPWFADYDDHGDLYILTELDVPWEQDGIRYFGEESERRRFYDLCVAELERRRIPYVRVAGPREQRFMTAVEAIDRLLAD